MSDSDVDWIFTPPDQSVPHIYTDNALSSPQAFTKPRDVLSRVRFTERNFRNLKIRIGDYSGNWVAPMQTVYQIRRELGPCVEKLERFEQGQLVAVSITSVETCEAATAVAEAGEEPVASDLLLERAIAIATLKLAGLYPWVKPWTADIDDAAQLSPATKPVSQDEIYALYLDYDDADEQGHFEVGSPDASRLVEIVRRIPDGAEVLDVGCNSGTFMIEAQKRGCRATGLDISPKLVGIAQRRGLNVVQGFAEALPFEPATFDAVLVGEVLEHVLLPAVVLAEVKRVLRDKGTVIGSVPAEEGLWGTDDVPFHPEHLRAFKHSDLDSALERAGLEAIEIFDLVHRGRDAADTTIFVARGSVQ